MQRPPAARAPPAGPPPDAWGPDEEELQPSAPASTSSQAEATTTAAVAAAAGAGASRPNAAATAASPAAAGTGTSTATTITPNATRTISAATTSITTSTMEGATRHSSSVSSCAGWGDPATSLQSICLAVVGMYIRDYVEALGPHLTFLPADSKATLLAVARRHRSLCDAVLLALLDASWRMLDVSGAGSTLSVEGFLRALQHLPQLQALDISGCAHLSSPAVLSAIASCCPQLRLLRCGAGSACNAAMESSLPPVLPGLVKPQVLADSWEEAFEGDDEGNADHNTAAACNISATNPTSQPASPAAALGHATTARLQLLRHVVWPMAPAGLIEQAQSQCPALQFHGASYLQDQSPAGPAGMGLAELRSSRQLGEALGVHRLWPSSAAAQHAAQLPPFLDPSIPMDEAWVTPLPHATWHGLPKAHLTPFAREQRKLARRLRHGASQQGEDQDSEDEEEEEELLPIAVRFRQAYIDRAQRLKHKAVKEQHQASLRQLRASPAMRALASWLDDF